MLSIKTYNMLFVILAEAIECINLAVKINTIEVCQEDIGFDRMLAGSDQYRVGTMAMGIRL